MSRFPFPTGAPIEGAQIQVRNVRSGASAGGITRANGQFFIQGVEPDMGYSLTVRRIGFEPITRDNIVVSLGQSTRTDFQLRAARSIRLVTAAQPTSGGKAPAAPPITMF